MAEDKELYSIHKLVGNNLFDGTVIAGCFTTERALNIASVINAFCMYAFICLCFFFIPFFPGSPFRVFGPPGNKLFSLPLFLPELPL